MRLYFNPVPCTGCMSCMAVCALRRAGDQDPGASALRVILDVFGGKCTHVSCLQCEEAACERACRQGAFRRDPGTGALVIDGVACTGCGSCVQACPHGAIWRWERGPTPVKCDLCGGAPSCVEACRFGVIRLLEPGNPSSSFSGMPEEEQNPDLGRGPGRALS